MLLATPICEQVQVVAEILQATEVKGDLSRFLPWKIINLKLLTSRCKPLHKLADVMGTWENDAVPLREL